MIAKRILIVASLLAFESVAVTYTAAQIAEQEIERNAERQKRRNLEEAIIEYANYKTNRFIFDERFFWVGHEKDEKVRWKQNAKFLCRSGRKGSVKIKSADCCHFFFGLKQFY